MPHPPVSIFLKENHQILLPSVLAADLDGKSFNIETIGFSGSIVLSFEDAVLKIEPHTEDIDATVAVMRWMTNRLPVPTVLHYEVKDSKSHLLMSRIPGKMTCDEYHLEHSDETVQLLAQGLNDLWNTDTTGCPRKRTLEDDLAHVRRNILAGTVDMEDFEANAKEFGTPENLLEWLETHKPEYDPVLSHGDYCMPNVLLNDGTVSGYIDLGAAGIADRYSDIVDCHWSLTANFNGTFGGKVYEDFDPDTLFDHLSIEIDRDKLQYYYLLHMLLG